MTSIVSITPGGYRANDARFLIGAIYWRARKTQDALRWWRQMTIDRRDSYVVASSDILRIIGHEVDDSRIDQALSVQINRILDAEHGRWLMFSFDRLRHFGYRFDSF